MEDNYDTRGGVCWFLFLRIVNVNANWLFAVMPVVLVR